ncbi:MAG: Mov34/MPN/PAD-1 family protein [Candidatus Hodarchaeales archaeon]|jgi:proteasome lid subunit RPN8/RPN11
MIEIPKKIYEKFLRFALENANPSKSRRSWKECIGLVLGKISDDKLFVTDIIPIGVGTSVFVDITDYEKVFSLISFERIDNGEVIIGWAHTHPGLGLFFSGTDIDTQLSYQGMHPKSFGLVLDPTQIQSEIPGFNIYRVKEATNIPYTVEYSFDEPFNFRKVKNLLEYELFEIKVSLAELEPIIKSKSEVEWGDITLKLDGPSEITFGKKFFIFLEIILPYRQYVRIDYHLNVHQVRKDGTGSLEEERSFFHETLSSGKLAIFSYKLDMNDQIKLELNDVSITIYSQETKKLPQLSYEVK